MNKIIKIFQLISIVIIVFVSGCDTVEEPYIEGNPFTGEYDSDLPIRKLLIEDFTGWACVNCPRASEEIHKLQESYGGHVVAIGVHAGFFADPNLGGGPDFRTDVGLELGGDGMFSSGFFNIAEQPIGVINRRNTGGDYLIADVEWSKEIFDILTINKFADINIELEITYDEPTKELEINVHSESLIELNSKLNLSVYLIENNIVGKQKDGSETIEDYVHQHVLRAGINGTWGNEISIITPLPKNTEFDNDFTYTIDDEWDISNCAIVAFIYDSETLEIIQVEESDLVGL